MNSLKNTVVIVLLLGVSYGVFQLMNSSGLNVANEEEPMVPEIELEGEGDDESTETIANSGSDEDSSIRQMPPNTIPGTGSGQPSAPEMLGNFPRDLNPTDPNRQQNPLPDSKAFPDALNSEKFPPANLADQDRRNFNGPLDQVPDQKSITGDGNTGNGNFANSNELVDVGKADPFPMTKVSPQDVFQDRPKSGNVGGATGQMIEDIQTVSNANLQRAYQQATLLTQQGNMKDALKLLSDYYHVEMSARERAELLMWLDSLAGKVIYSRDHRLAGTPYVVRENDSLQSIADRWNVPARLVYKINEQTLTNNPFESGMQLKRVQGPFRAEVNVSKKEMTMFLDEMYAGRFPLDFGRDLPIQTGSYAIQRKSDQGQIYRDQLGKALSPTDRNNPYGQYWMDLGNGICIHGKSTADERGCIRVDAKHVADVYGILSQNSEIKIVR